MQEQEVEMNTDAEVICDTLRTDVRRFGIGLLLIVLIVFAMHSLLRSRDSAIAPDPMVEIEPLYKYGDEVRITSGFYQGLRAVIVDWDEKTCEYTIEARGLRYGLRVREDQIIDQSRTNRGAPFESPEPTEADASKPRQDA